MKKIEKKKTKQNKSTQSNKNEQTDKKQKQNKSKQSNKIEQTNKQEQAINSGARTCDSGLTVALHMCYRCLTLSLTTVDS